MSDRHFASRDKLMEHAPNHALLAQTDYSGLALAVGATGLSWRGGFHPKPEHAAPCLPNGNPTLTLVLLGFTGHNNWDHFSASPEAKDGQPHPLDRWSRRVIDRLAIAVGAAAVYPFPTDRPPFFPFQRWALAAEAVYESPIKILIHPDWGLWHSYRGALLFSKSLDLPERDTRPSPCNGCADKPCLSTCPTAAFAGGMFSVSRCLKQLHSEDGADCLELGCRARRACPVGAKHRYERAEARLHMGTFLAQQSHRAGDIFRTADARPVLAGTPVIDHAKFQQERKPL